MRALLNIFIVAVLVSLYAATPAYADEIRPALLDIKQQNTGLFAVTWKVPTRGDKVLAITPQLPDSLELLGTPTLQQAPGALQGLGLQDVSSGKKLHINAQCLQLVKCSRK